MANRVPLSERRERDVKGVDRLFTPPAPIAENPDQEDRASENETTPESKTTVDVETSSVPTGMLKQDNGVQQQTASSEPAQTASSKPALAKVTIYVRPDQVVAIETIQLEQRQKTGKKPDKSDLVQEALDLLVTKYQQM